MHASPPDLPAIAGDYLEALLRVERSAARRLVLDVLDAGVTIRDLYLEVFQRSQRELGRRWELGQVSVAQEHFCTAATQLLMAELYPRIFSGARGARVFVATSVSGELHELGVRMVADFFELAGWSTRYLGANVPNDQVIAALVEQRAELLGISATLDHHRDAVQDLIAAVRRAPGCGGVKIMVGGRAFADDAPARSIEVGADGWAADADEAVRVAATLQGGLG